MRKIGLASRTRLIWPSPCVGGGRQQGRSQDFRGGGAKNARASRARKFGPRPLTEWKGRSSNYHRERVPTVASELESRFLNEFREKVSLWLSSKLFFL